MGVSMVLFFLKKVVALLMEKEMATHFSILAWRIPTDRGTWWATVHGLAKSLAQLSN